MTQLLTIEAMTEETERPALIAASEQLRACLGPALGTEPTIELHFHNTPSSIDGARAGTVIIFSFLREAFGNEPLDGVEARWRKTLDTLGQTQAPVFLCTIFRHLPNARRTSHAARAGALLERIRRLNLLIAELSHDTGVNVIDIDRALAHIGARMLATDFRLAGEGGAAAAGHAIAFAVLAGGLDDWASADALERAKKQHGTLRDAGLLLGRRLGSGRMDGNGIAATITLNAPDPGV